MRCQPRGYPAERQDPINMRKLFLLFLLSSTAFAEDPKPCKGENSTDCVVVPVAKKQVEAKFTKAAKAAEVDGRVVLSCTVGVDGRAHDIKVVHALGYGLDENAVKALHKWKFKPAHLNGKAVPWNITIETEFVRE
jgi:TonB family protein